MAEPLRASRTRAQRYGPCWQQRLGEPLDNLHRLGRRAWLAVLGIAVGCMAVVALLSIGHNAEREALSVFEGLGSDLLVANVLAPEGGHAQSAQASTRFDTRALHAALPPLAAVAALSIASADARLAGRMLSTTVLGSSAELAEVIDLHMAQGRFLSPFDAHSTHVVLGANVAAEWAKAGVQVRPGDPVQLGGYLFQVIGILRPRGHNPLLPLAVDDSILMPLESMGRLVSRPQVATVLARYASTTPLAQAAPALRQALQRAIPRHDVDVQVPQLLLEGLARQSRLFSWLLTGLGSIALLVGGIGVMNVMLMNVAERRREIGVRLALGARPQDIAGLFLVEALMLAAVGALLGAVVGLIAAWAFVQHSGWAAFSLSVSALPLGIGSALLAGLVFGLSPALAAARLTPVQALRDV